jgi:basic membrane protein A
VIVEATPQLERLSRVTARFPKTRFLVPDSVFDPDASFRGQRNVTGVNFHDRENAELGGYLAGLMTHGHEAVSAVGGIRAVPSVRDLIAGFKTGARLARPGIRVLVTYTQTFYPLSRCAKAASWQIEHHSAVVFDAAGECGTRALQATMTRGVWGIGVDSDLSYLGPTMLASVVKRFDRATQLAVELFASGQLPRGRDIQLDLSSGNIGLTGINSAAVPDAVQRKVTALAATLH